MDQLRAFQSLGMGNPFRSTKDMPGRFKNAFTFKEHARGDSLAEKIIASAPIVQEQEKFEEDVDTYIKLNIYQITQIYCLY